MSAAFLNIAYIIAAIFFIFGIKMLGSADTARRGNMVSALGMLLAVVVTLFQTGMDFTLIGIGLGVGGVTLHAPKPVRLLRIAVLGARCF